MLSHDRLEDRGRLVAAMPCRGGGRRRCHCEGSDDGVRTAGAMMEAVTKSDAIETCAGYSRDMSGIFGGAVGVVYSRWFVPR